jgi:hypothetical protein
MVRSDVADSSLIRSQVVYVIHADDSAAATLETTQIGQNKIVSL